MISSTGFGYVMNIYVGLSKERKKEIILPYEGVFVEPIFVPPNPQKSKWITGRFKVDVNGKTLCVTRVDRDKGWGMHIVLRAFYSKNVIHTHSPDYDTEIQNEGSAITVKLMPDQKIRCLKQSLLFQGEDVIMLADNIDALTRKTLPGLIKSGMKTVNNGVRKALAVDGKKSGMAEYSFFGLEGTYGLVTLSEKYPFKILHLSLGEYGNRLIVKEGSLVASSASVEIIDSGLLDSLQWLVGNGDIILRTGPTTKRLILKNKEAVAIREDCLLILTQDIQSSTQNIDKLKGIFESKSLYRRLVGPGVIWVDYRLSNIVVENIDDEDFSIGSSPMERIDDTISVD